MAGMSDSPETDDLIDGFTTEQLRHLYRAVLLPRMIEEKMLRLLRQGRLTKWFSGIGQEAIATGVVTALEPRDFILPMHRNLGVFTGRDVHLPRLFRQLLGREGGFTKGRDRTFHFGHLEKGIVGHDQPPRGDAAGGLRDGPGRAAAGPGPGGGGLHRRRGHVARATSTRP